MPHAFFPVATRAVIEPLIHKEFFRPFDVEKLLARFTIFVHSKEADNPKGERARHKMTQCPQESENAGTELGVAFSIHHLVTDGSSELMLLHEFMQLVTGLDSLPATRQFSDVVKVDTMQQRKQKKLQLWIEMFQSAKQCISFPSILTEERSGNSRPVEPILVTACTGGGESCLYQSPTSLEYLPAQLPLWQGQGIVGAHCYQLIPAAVMSQVKSLARSNGISSMIVVVTSLAAALCQFLGERDIVIGVAYMNRNRRSQHTHGYLANVLPIRIDFSSSKELGALLKRVRHNWSLILDGGVDLADLVPVLPCLQSASTEQSPSSSSSSSIPHSLKSHSPLQVLVSYYESLPPIPPSWDIAGVKVHCEWMAPRPGHTHVDLVLEGMPAVANAAAARSGHKGGYRFNWDYRTSALSLYDIKALSEAMLCFIEQAHGGCGQVEPLLERVSSVATKMADFGESTGSSAVATQYSVARGVTAGPNCDGEIHFEFGDLSIASAASQAYLTTEPPSSLQANLLSPPDTATPPAEPHNVDTFYFQRFESKAREISDSPLFRHANGGTTTYGEALSHVASLASFLYHQHGARPDDHIGVYMSRTPSLYTTILAVLKLSASYVPIALQNPPERVAKILSLSDSHLLLTESHLVPRLQGYYTGQTVSVDVVMATIGTDIPPEIPPGEICYSADQIFYIIFTSGTTGDPKGVAVTNSNMLAGLSVFEQLITPSECQLTIASINVSFDPHVLDSLAPMLLGACLMVAENITHVTDPAYAGVTYGIATASSAAVMKFPDTIRALLIGGEAFTSAAYKSTRFVPKVINCYGPTECTITSTVKWVQSVDDIGSIGVPPVGAKVMVMNDQHHIVPVEVEGVLHVGGPIVSPIGYYRNEEKTKQVFFPNPYAPSETIYCTGDLVRMLKDGTLEFIGRQDDQVKLRGMRMQLGEVERALCSDPSVTAAAALVDRPGQPAAKLVGFVTPELVDTEALLGSIALRIPSYMVPSVLVPLESMPLTRQGKIDRRALAAMVPKSQTSPLKNTASVDGPQHRSVDETDSSAPMGRENTMRKIARVFGQVLGVQSYPVGADFFALGGHSLLTFQLQRQVNEELGSCLSLADVLQHPTPVTLGALISRDRGDEEERGDEDRVKERKMEKSHLWQHSTKNQTDGSAEEGKIGVSSSCIVTDTADGKVQHGTDEVTLHAIHSMGESELIGNEVKHLKQQGSKGALKLNYLSPVPATPISPELSQKFEEFLQSQTQLQESTAGRSVHQWSAEFAHNSKELCDMLRKETGFHLPPQSLSHYGSLDHLQTCLKLKTVLSFQQTSKSPTLVLHPPSSSSDETPIFFIHGGIIGWPLPYLRLAKYLSRFCVAVQYTPHAPTTTFEDMAAYYAEAVRAVKCNGPYVLVGVCYGALLVYEIARQISAAGEMVKLIVLVNNSPSKELRPEAFDFRGYPLANSPLDPINFFQELLDVDLTHLGRDSEEEEEEEENGLAAERVLVTEQEWIRQPADVAKREGKEMGNIVEGENCSLHNLNDVVDSLLGCLPDLPFTSEELKSVYLRVLNIARCAWHDYHPQPIHNIQNCILIRCRGQHPFFQSHDYGLGKLVGAGNLSVIVPPQSLGLLSEETTMRFIGGVMDVYLGCSSTA